VRRAFISDCEGPISKNDNAFETTAHFVPNGDKLFTVISKYDDVLAEVLKRPGYKAGNTLKLILPFLKGYDVTDQKMREFSAQGLILMANAKDTLQYVRGVTPAFIVSTSYEHYIKALCYALAFPYDNTYCTRLSIDRYCMAEKEKTKLKALADEIAQMLVIGIPPEARSLGDFCERDQRTIKRLHEIFWKEIVEMEFGTIFSEVNPVGGDEKAEAVKDVAERLGISLADVMYVGDSITDVEAFRLVRENGGLTVSFNGNQYAVKNAEVAVLSESSIVTAIIADAFCRLGKQQAINLGENWTRKALKESSVNKTLLNRLLELYPEELPKVKIITSENMEFLVKESVKVRKRVRGEAIGRLG
jgi:energy-converting hydrogenase A subunit R